MGFRAQLTYNNVITLQQRNEPVRTTRDVQKLTILLDF